MIEAKALTARSAPVALAPTTFALGAGLHALLGAPADGVPLLLAAIAGRVRPRAGAILTLGKPPAAVRAKIAYVPRDLVLPRVLSVEETLAVAAEVRGEAVRPAAERLAALGVESLAGRAVRTLSRGEARAVAMAEAVTSSASLLLFDEPYAGLDPRSAVALATRLRERASKGSCVVVGTASVRDAADLADAQLVFDRGVLVRAFGVDSAKVTRIAPVPRPRAGAGSPAAQLALRVSDAPAVLARLAGEAAVGTIVTEASHIVVSGADATELAAAVGRAVLAAGADVTWMRAEAPPLSALRG